MVGNLFWGNHLCYFGTKFRSMDAQVLFRSFCAKITQSTTAITSIVVAKATNLKIKRESLLKFLLLFAFAKSRISLFSRHCEANHRFAKAIQSKNQSAQSANPIKSFCYFWLSPKVESPFFIDSAFDSQSIRATNRNGRDCGGGFVFVRIFGRETRLVVCERPKILTSAKDAPKSELPRNNSIYLQITHKSTAFKANLI